jgi:tetratricopeptide (TPR) repeat protein
MIEDRMHHIDSFFQGSLSPDDARSFEEKILSDPAFAADLAFYISAKQAARELIGEEKKNRFRELLGATNGHREPKKMGKVTKMWYVVGASMAAAISTAVIVGVFLLNTPSVQEVAQNYVTRNYHELSVKMGREDEVQQAVELYNNAQYAQALVHFENVLKIDTSFNLLNNAALSALNAHDYDKALKYFRTMEQYKSQLSNPAVFMQAVTYMERNQPGDKEQAKLLLEKVRNSNLDGKEKADEWIKLFDK